MTPPCGAVRGGDHTAPRANVVIDPYTSAACHSERGEESPTPEVLHFIQDDKNLLPGRRWIFAEQKDG